MSVCVYILSLSTIYSYRYICLYFTFVYIMCILRHIIHMNKIRIYIYIYIYMCVCVCVYVCTLSLSTIYSYIYIYMSVFYICV